MIQGLDRPAKEIAGTGILSSAQAAQITLETTDEQDLRR